MNFSELPYKHTRESRSYTGIIRSRNENVRKKKKNIKRDTVAGNCIRYRMRATHAITPAVIAGPRLRVPRVERVEL